MITTVDEFRAHIERHGERAPGREAVAAALWPEILKDPELHVWAAIRGGAPDSVLEFLSESGDPRVRAAVAMVRRLPAPLFERLAKDPDDGVRMTVACNRRTPRSVLEFLARDAWEDVARAAEERLQEEGR